MIKKKTYDVYRPNKDWRSSDFPRILLHFDPSVSKYYMNTRHMRIQDLRKFDYYMSGELIIVKPHSKSLTEEQSEFLDHHRRLLTLTDPDASQSSSSTIIDVKSQTMITDQSDGKQSTHQNHPLSILDVKKSAKSTDACFKMYSETECFFTMPRYYAYAIWGEACMESHNTIATYTPIDQKNLLCDSLTKDNGVHEELNKPRSKTKTTSLRMNKGNLNAEWQQLVHLYKQAHIKTNAKYSTLHQTEKKHQQDLVETCNDQCLNYDMNVLQNTVFCPMTTGSPTQPLFFNTRLSSQVIDQLDVVKKVLIQMHDPHATHGGLVEMPCGTGKTVVSLACWCFLQCHKDVNLLKSIDYDNYHDMFNMTCTQKRASVKLLFLVGKADLINQTRMRIRQFVPDARIGLIKRDHCPNVDAVDVVIGSIQTLANRHFPPTFFKHFGMVIVDEARNWATPVYANGIKYIPCKYKLALDATPVLYSGRQAYLEIIYGSKIVRVEQPKIPQTVKMLVYTHANQTPIHNKKIGKTDKNKQTTRLMLDHTRNQYIIHVIFDILYGSMNRGYVQDTKSTNHRTHIAVKPMIIDSSAKKSFIDYCVNYVNQLTLEDGIKTEISSPKDVQSPIESPLHDASYNVSADWTMQSKQLENCYQDMIRLYDEFCQIDRTCVMDVDPLEKKMNNDDRVSKQNIENIDRVKTLYARYKQLEQRQASILDSLMQHQTLECYRPLRLPHHYLSFTYRHKNFSTAMKSNEQAPHGQKKNTHGFEDDVSMIIPADDWLQNIVVNHETLYQNDDVTKNTPKKDEYCISSAQAKLFLATKSRLYTSHMATNLIYKMDGKRFVGNGNLFESYFKQAKLETQENEMNMIKHDLSSESNIYDIFKEGVDDDWLDSILPSLKKPRMDHVISGSNQHEMRSPSQTHVSSNSVKQSKGVQHVTLASYLGLFVDTNNEKMFKKQTTNDNTPVTSCTLQKTTSLTKNLDKKRKRSDFDKKTNIAEAAPRVGTLNVYHQYHARLRIPMIFVDRVQHAIILMHMAVTEWFHRYYDTGYTDPILLFRGNRQKLGIYSLQMCVNWFAKNNIALSKQDRTWLSNYADYQKKKQIHFDASFFESIKTREDEEGVAVTTDTNETFMERTFQWIPIIPCSSYITHLKKLKEKHESHVNQINMLQSPEHSQTHTLLTTSLSSKTNKTICDFKSTDKKTIYEQIKHLRAKLLSHDALVYVEKKIRQWDNMSTCIKKLFDHIQQEQNARDADALYKIDRQGCFVDIVKQEKSTLDARNTESDKKPTIKTRKKTKSKTNTCESQDCQNEANIDMNIMVKQECTMDEDNDAERDENSDEITALDTYTLKPLYTFGLYMGAVDTKSIYTMTKEDETTALNTDMVFATHFKAGDAIDRPEICTIVQTMPLKDSRQADGRGKRFDLFKQSYCLAWIVEPWSYYQHEYYTHLEFYKCSQAYIDSYSTAPHVSEKKTCKK